MKKFLIPTKAEDERSPDQILQDYADALMTDSKELLSGQVIENISYDSEDRPKIAYALHVFVNKLRQSYRLFEVEQLTEQPYPVDLNVFTYTGRVNFANIRTAIDLEKELDALSKSPIVGNLLAHFIRLSDLKD